MTAWRGNPAPPPAASPAVRSVRVVRIATIFYGIAALFAVGYSLFTGNVGSLLGEAVPDGAGLMGGILLGVGVVGLCHVGRHMFPSVERAAGALSDLIGPLTIRGAVSLALLSGVSEELLFRGALWPMGLAGTSLLFGVVHVIPRRALALYPLFAACMGLLLGLLRAWTHNVIPAMLAHVVVNGANLVWLEMRRRKSAKAAA